MAATPNPYPGPITTTRTAREFITVCTRHNIPCGSPQDLAGFLRAIEADKHFAMDFWSVVARHTDQPDSSNDRLLDAVVEAVAGQTPPEARASSLTQAQSVASLQSLLTGVDTPAPLVPQALLEEFAAPRAPLRPVRLHSRPGRQPLHVHRRQPTAPTPFGEPKSTRPPASAPVPPPTPDPIYNPQVRLTLRSESPAADPPPLQGRSSRSVPFDHYTDDGPSPFARIAGAGLALLVLAGLSFFVFHQRGNLGSGWNRISTSIRAGFAATNATWNHWDNSRQSTLPPTAPTSADQLPPAETPGPQASAAKQSFAAPQAATSQPLPPSPQFAASPQPAPPARADSPNSTVPAEELPHPVPLEPESAGRVVVPAAQMKDYLISSRVPVPPPGVRATGHVVLDAVVTSRGTVRNLRVVSGDLALRQSAIDAVSHWHYRPYQLNGEPVDVSTTINVNFSGSR